MMPANENKALVSRFVQEVLNGGNVDAMDDLLSSDVIDHRHNHHPINSVKESMKALHGEVPDLAYKIEDVVAEGDKVMFRLSLRAKHPQQLPGGAPGQKDASVSSLHLVRIRNGKIAEHWSANLTEEQVD